MTTLLLLMAVIAGLVFHAFHDRGYWLMLGIAAIAVAGSIHAFVEGAWPIGAIEAAWAALVVRRWSQVKPLQGTKTCAKF